MTTDDKPAVITINCHYLAQQHGDISCAIGACVHIPPFDIRIQSVTFDPTYLTYTATYVVERSPMPEKEFWSVSEFANLFKMSEASVRVYISNGVIKTVQFKPKGTHYLPRSEVEKWMRPEEGKEEKGVSGE